MDDGNKLSADEASGKEFIRPHRSDEEKGGELTKCHQFAMCVKCSLFHELLCNCGGDDIVQVDARWILTPTLEWPKVDLPAPFWNSQDERLRWKPLRKTALRNKISKCTDDNLETEAVSSEGSAAVWRMQVGH